MNSARRIVIDTGVLISAMLTTHSIPRQAYRKAQQNFEVCVSRYALDELARVIERSKFDAYLPITKRVEFFNLYQKETTEYPVTLEVTDCRDPKDNPFLALALTVKAQIILTSDPDLHSLDPYHGIRILRPAQFLEIA